MRPFLNATFLNATFLSNIEAQLRWLWLAAGALLWLGIPTAAAAPSRSRADGSSVLWLTVTDQLLWWQAPLWLTWPILFRCHLLCLVVGVGSLYRVRHTDPGRFDPLNMDPSCKGLAPVLMMHATMENGNTDSCHECCAPLSLGYTHCPICKACIRRRWWHCCLMGVCIGAGNRRQFVLLIVMIVIATIASALTLALTELPFMTLHFMRSFRLLVRAAFNELIT